MSKRPLFQTSFTARIKAQRKSQHVESSNNCNEDRDNIELRKRFLVDTTKEAVEVVENILRDVDTGYILEPWKTFEKNWQNRAHVFYEFEVLCLSN